MHSMLSVICSDTSQMRATRTLMPRPKCSLKTETKMLMLCSSASMSMRRKSRVSCSSYSRSIERSLRRSKVYLLTLWTSPLEQSDRRLYARLCTRLVKIKSQKADQNLSFLSKKRRVARLSRRRMKESELSRSKSKENWLKGKPSSIRWRTLKASVLCHMDCPVSP